MTKKCVGVVMRGNTLRTLQALGRQSLFLLQSGLYRTESLTGFL